MIWMVVTGLVCYVLCKSAAHFTKIPFWAWWLLFTLAGVGGIIIWSAGS